MDFGHLIDLFRIAQMDHKAEIEKIADQIMKYQDKGLVELATPLKIRSVLELLKQDELRQFLWICTAVRVILESKPRPEIYGNPVENQQIYSQPRGFRSSNPRRPVPVRPPMNQGYRPWVPNPPAAQERSTCEQLITWLIQSKSELIRKTRTDAARYDTFLNRPSYLKAAAKFILGNTDDPLTKIIDEMRSQKTSKEQLNITLKIWNILNSEGIIKKTVDSQNGPYQPPLHSYQNPHPYSPSLNPQPMSPYQDQFLQNQAPPASQYFEQYPFDRTPQPYQNAHNSYWYDSPQTKIDYQKNMDEQKKAMEKTRENFLNELNKKKASLSPDISLPDTAKSWQELEISRLKELEQKELLRQEELRHATDMKNQKECFEKELDFKKYENKMKDDFLREEKAKKDQKAERELRERLEKQRKEYEENFQKIQKEIEDYEKETQRLLKERVEMWKKCTEAFFACVYMKQLFEEKEKEWSNWLDSLRDSIRNVKTRFVLFNKILIGLSKEESSYEKIVMDELVSLHKSTLSSYDLLFEACHTVASLYSKFRDGAFLHILRENLVDVSNKLCRVLEDIDSCMNFLDSLESLGESFDCLKPSEIPTTGELRKAAKSFSDRTPVNKNPRVYRDKSSVIFEDVTDNPGPSYLSNFTQLTC